MTRETNIATQGKAAQHLNAGEIGRFHDGQIVERWGSTDELGIMQQLGAAPNGAKEGVFGKVADTFKS